MSEDYKYGLSKEEYDKAMADMHNAYKIRDENGNLLRWFQDHPIVLQTHMHHFLHYCGLEGD